MTDTTHTTWATYSRHMTPRTMRRVFHSMISNGRIVWDGHNWIVVGG